MDLFKVVVLHLCLGAQAQPIYHLSSFLGETLTTTGFTEERLDFVAYFYIIV